MNKIKTNYKGHVLEVTREKSLGGWDTLYYSVYTPTGYELLSSFEDSEEKIRDKLEQLKEVVDRYIENPSEFEED